MKVCEACFGTGCKPPQTIRPLKMCDHCHGTGLICLGEEGADRYALLVATARRQAAENGWLEEVWIGEPGNAVKRWVPVVVELKKERCA